VDVLLDTDVLVDCLRGTDEARKWLAANQATSLVLPGIVAMELVQGARDKSDLARVTRFIERFAVAWPNDAEFRLAFELLTSLGLSTGLGIPDCLVAAAALSRGATLLTFNRKHFEAVPGLMIEEPYARG